MADELNRAAPIAAQLDREWVQRTWFECNQDLYVFAQAVEARRAVPVAAQLDAELPPLPAALSRDDTEHDVDYFTAEQYRQGQRDAIAPYAERIRLLEQDNGLLSLIADQFKVRLAAADAHIERLEAAERQAKQPAQTIDTPEFRRLINEYREACEMVRGHAIPQWRALIAYIDGRTTGTAPDAARECTQPMLEAAMKAAVAAKMFPPSGSEDAYLRYWYGMKASVNAALAAAPSPQENTN